MLFERIKADRRAAMLARDKPKASLLGTLESAASRDVKVPDDATVLRAIRAFLKAIDETLAVAGERDVSPQRREKAILEAYLPREPSPEELRDEAAALVAALPERSPRDMGRVMAGLKARFGPTLDGRQAAPIVKDLLAG